MTPDTPAHPGWVLRLFGLIRKHWHHQGRCYSIHFDARRNQEKRFWELDCGPVRQQTYGGPFDGADVWTGFVFDASGFSREWGVWLQDFCVQSLNGTETPRPQMLLKGSYRRRNFFINIFLEPEDGLPVSEILDTTTDSVRPAKNDEEEDF